jgi:hypothetical protein
MPSPASEIVSYDPHEDEIRLVPVLFDISNEDSRHACFDPFGLKVVSHAEEWTWQDSELRTCPLSCSNNDGVAKGAIEISRSIT